MKRVIWLVCCVVVMACVSPYRASAFRWDAVLREQGMGTIQSDTTWTLGKWGIGETESFRGIIVDTGVVFTLSETTDLTLEGTFRVDGTLVNHGKITIRGDEGVLINGGKLENHGIIVVENAGVLNKAGGSLVNEGTIRIQNGGDTVGLSNLSYTVNGVVRGSSLVNNGTIEVASGANVGIRTNAGAELANNGTITAEGAGQILGMVSGNAVEYGG